MWVSQVRERLRTLFRGARADAESAEEMRFHIDMEAERLMGAEGLDAEAARRRAILLFGGVDRHGEAVRDARGFGGLSGLSLDVKLGARMLRKHPGLTVAAVLTLAIAVGLAAALFEFSSDMARPRLALEDSERVVGVQLIDRGTSQAERRVLHDYELWREQVTTIEHLSAFSTGEVTMTTNDGRFTTLRVARMTPSALAAAGFTPVLGRTFDAADDVDGAPLPVLIAHAVWQELFDGAAAVIGSEVRVGDQPAVVVGVMQEGFGFPINQELWLPLRERGSALEPRTGPPISVFGRLAPGVSVAEAQAELTAIGERMAAQYPQTHEQLRPRVRRVSDTIAMGGFVRIINVPFILFLLVVSANVATLVFARTAARTGEIAVRSALGASRRRLVLQLVMESFVLTGIATALGLVAAQWGLRRGFALFWEVQQMAPPYFLDDALSAPTIVYALGLALLAATIIGGLPALKATGRNLRPRLMYAGSGGTGLRFGAVSTAVIVLQVALCVAFVPAAVMAARGLLPDRSETSFPAHDYLAARIAVQPDAAPAAAAPPASFAAVKQRLAELPGVTRVALVSRLPGFNHPTEPLQLETDTTAAFRVRVAGVDPDFFAVVGARIIAGRDFAPGEYQGDARVVVVDADWAQRELGGSSPVGQRFHLSERGDGPAWYEVVGVIEGMAVVVGSGSEVALYLPLHSGDDASVQAYLRTSVPPATLVREVHESVMALDRRFALTEVKPLDEVWRPVLRSDLFFLAGLNVVAMVIVLFALVGIYALLSFTVAQRAREIAIRAALGASRGSILRSIFARAVTQIGLGVLLGAAIVSIALVRSADAAGIVATIAGLVLLFGAGGCVVPVVRALRVHPTEALKAE